MGKGRHAFLLTIPQCSADWSGIQDVGKRSETLVACHLMKTVQGLGNQGYGDLGLHYLRDKEKREVDFLVSRDGEPWFLVEVKHSPSSLSPNLAYFQQQTESLHAFQVAMEADFIDADCFSRTDPVEVPALTFLSQLL